MTDLDDEIEKILEEHMPQKMYEVLKDKINDYDSIFSQLKKLRVDYKTLKEENKTLESFKTKEKALLDKEDKLIEKEKQIAEDRQKIDIDNLHKENALLEDKVNFMRDITMGLVRNTEYRKSVYKDIPHTDENNYTQINTQTENETVKLE